MHQGRHFIYLITKRVLGSVAACLSSVNTLLHKSVSRFRGLWPVILIVFLSVSCSSGHVKAPLASSSIVVDNDHRMRFSGKGAGAGMMMSASMGPVGIAIGVAIDEGIAKQIGEAAAAAGVDIPSVLRNALARQPQRQITYHLDEYGFRLSTGGAEDIVDPVIPYFTLTDTDTGTRVATDEKCQSRPISLEQAKAEGERVGAVFEALAACFFGGG